MLQSLISHVTPSLKDHGVNSSRSRVSVLIHGQHIYQTLEECERSARASANGGEEGLSALLHYSGQI